MQGVGASYAMVQHSPSYVRVACPHYVLSEQHGRWELLRAAELMCGQTVLNPGPRLWYHARRPPDQSNHKTQAIWKGEGPLILWSSRKNAYLALPKHVGGPNNIHNIASTSFHDFDNKIASVRSNVSTYSKDALIKYETWLVWLNDLMVCYIEREIFKWLDLQKVKKAFEKKKDRQVQLTRSPRCN
jgi:hypothetical protein